MKNIGKSDLKRQSQNRVFGLTQEGQVPLAIVRWNRHMSTHEECVCESKMLSQTLCGFCLLSRLQTEGLAQASQACAHPFLQAAQTISGYLMARRGETVKLAAE